MGFRLVLISVTLNDLERRNSSYFYVTVVEDRPIRFSAEYPLPVIFQPKLTHAAVVQSICDDYFSCE